MDVETFLERTSYALRGTDEEPPTVGDDEANYWLSVFNRKKDELYEDTTKNWRYSYDVRSIGTISADPALILNLPTDFIAPSGDESTGDGMGGGAYAITTDGQRINLALINPEERNPHAQAVFIAGLNPEKLHFTCPIGSDDRLVGAELFLPGHYMPADVQEADDLIPLSVPSWGVMATASEIAFNDITYEDKSPDLNDKANALYRQMERKNRGTVHNSPRPVRTNIARIRGVSGR